MISWHLKPFLDKHELSAYALVQHTAGTLAPATVYGLARAQPNRVDLETLDKIITALQELTGETITVCDLLEYRKSKAKA